MSRITIPTQATLKAFFLEEVILLGRVLDNKAMSFEAWMNSGTPEANFVRTMFMTSENIALDSPMFQNQVIPLLLSQSVIDQEVVDRISAKISDAGEGGGDGTDTVEAGLKRYRVLVPPEVTNPIEWVSQYCDRDHYTKIEGGYVYIDTLGECTAPGVEEVTA